MSSIEELIGFPDFDDSPESVIEKRKIRAEMEMEFFDVLPKELRDFINENEVGIEANQVAILYKHNGYDVKSTIKEIERQCDDYKRRNFR